MAYMTEVHMGIALEEDRLVKRLCLYSHVAEPAEMALNPQADWILH